MTKRSRIERSQRTREGERTSEIERAWWARLPADVAHAFDAQVRAAEARGPRPAPVGQAPGTAPNPPRPGREPKPPKQEAARGRRR